MRHQRDEDCTLDDQGTCIECGVYHGDAPEARGIVPNEEEIDPDSEDGFLETVKDALDCELPVGRARIETFQEAGVLSKDRGLVVRMNSGAEFQITIVKAK